jgi:hypothetical protein
MDKDSDLALEQGENATNDEVASSANLEVDRLGKQLVVFQTTIKSTTEQLNPDQSSK